MTQNEAVEEIGRYARGFVNAMDEFWPDYPEGVGERLELLVSAVDQYGRVCEESSAVERAREVIAGVIGDADYWRDISR